MIEERHASTTDLDRAVAELQAHKDAWARLSPGKKIPYLVVIRARTSEVAEDWVAAAARAKGIDGTPWAGEEWISGPWALLYATNRLIETMSAISRDGTPRLQLRAVRTRADGQVVVDVFPRSLYDRLLVGGVSAEVWMQPGMTPDTLADTMAVFYKQPRPEGRVSLVLGAGNIASIPPLDALYKLYAEGQVCLLKLNPVNEYLGPFFEQIFAPLIDDGYLRIVYGGAATGALLCRHDGIDTIHMTGSAATHDTIVFGAGSEGAVRKRRNEPLIDKPITSELGNVSPTIVVPGPWSAADVRFQAEHIATQKMHNGGFNCIAAQVLILPEGWNETPRLMDGIRRVLRDTPRRAYYPGASERQQKLAAVHPTAERLDRTGDGADAPRILIADLDPADGAETCYTDEAFGAVLAVTMLPGADAAAFLRQAVAFCNHTLRGTLGANIIVHPATIKELGPAMDQAIAALRYGCVAVNAWTGVGFLIAQASWGAYPGHRPNDIGSGIGVVHNSYLFDKAQKSVVRGPFYPFPRGVAHGQFALLPKPPWFVTHKAAHRVGRGLVQFEARPGVRRLPRIVADALRG